MFDKDGNIKIVDFGTAKRHIGPDGEVYSQRTNEYIQGTPLYAPVVAHVGIDLCRRDDLWSILFMLVEFATGSLPWSDIDNLKLIELEKYKFMVSANLPSVFQRFKEHLRTLGYEDRPDYDYLISLLQSHLEALERSDDRVLECNQRCDWITKMKDRVLRLFNVLGLRRLHL